MNIENHKRLFNRIAPVYNLFFQKQYKAYSEVITNYGAKLSVPEKGKILDIGCGTGALIQAFADHGYDAQGVDMAGSMVSRARHRGLNCYHGNALHGLNFGDSSFDLVSTSFVAHGLDRDKRMTLYGEAKRVSKSKVLIHDYSHRREFLISMIESMERGDYFNFIKYGLDEMWETFSHVEVIELNNHSNWYICTV